MSVALSKSERIDIRATPPVKQLLQEATRVAQKTGVFQSTFAIAGEGILSIISPPMPYEGFQSTFAIAGEGIGKGDDVLAVDVCFNPHSPLLANEFQKTPHSTCRTHGFNPHSPLLANEFPIARARYAVGARFNPHLPLLANELSTSSRWHPLQHLFQSTFAIAGEGIFLCPTFHLGSSPRSFQSTFAIAGEGIPLYARTGAAECEFQSTFAIAGEGIRTGAHNTGAKADVSIHIRHCWRMNLQVRDPETRKTQSVSIHIRHCWRMNWRSRAQRKWFARFNPHSPLLANEFIHRFAAGFLLAGFNPHSPLLANELMGPPPSSVLPSLFQSTFVIAGEGIMALAERNAVSVKRFNPHSPLLANELQLVVWVALVAVRFNPHSPLLANEFGRCDWCRRIRVVSIHIRHCWRMNCRAHAVRLTARTCFNPHSPLLANEFTQAIINGLGQLVSIHIRHCWRMN